jgi:hypothetical protein
MLMLATVLLPIIIAAAGKALIGTWLLGGGIGTFIVLFILFKMIGR